MSWGDKYFKMQSQENESNDLQQAKAENAFWWHTLQINAAIRSTSPLKLQPGAGGATAGFLTLTLNLR